jgi:hypothetical protein
MTPVKILAVLLVLVGSLGVSGCSMFGKKKSEAPEATLPTWLGRVVMVDEVHRFALVDTGSRTVPAAGVMVFTLQEKQKTSTLRATGEARPPYLALEIVDGLPAIGDQAVLDESHEVADSPPAAIP